MWRNGATPKEIFRALCDLRVTVNKGDLYLLDFLDHDASPKWSREGKCLTHMLEFNGSGKLQMKYRGTAEHYCEVIWTRKCSERHWMSTAHISAWHSTCQTRWRIPSNRARRVPNCSSVKSSMTDITYFRHQHMSLHKWFSGKGPILRKKWTEVFEQHQHLFRYQTLWSRWCWLNPLPNEESWAKNQAGKWLLQICENLRSVGVHNMHLQHRLSKKWTCTVLKDICKLSIPLTW